MDLYAKDECPNVAEELWWLSRQWDASVNSRVLEVVDEATPVHWGNTMPF